MTYLRPLVFTLVLLFFPLALAVDRAAGIIYSLLLLLAIWGSVGRFAPDNISLARLSRQYWPLLLAMAGPLLAVLCNQLLSGVFFPREYDMQLRLALFALVFWVIAFIPLEQMKHIQWGFLACAFLATGRIFVLTNGGQNRYTTDFIPITVYGELVLLAGVFAMFSLIWNRSRKASFFLLKFLALCATLYATYLSQSRGVWISVLIFAAIFFLALKQVPMKLKVASLIAALLLVLVSFHYNGILKERLAAVQTDMVQYDNGSNLDTSLGTRLQLWRGSWQLFKEHPLTGVGIAGYPSALRQLAERKIITPDAATFAHSHNEILFVMARLGSIGLLSLLAIYFVPFYYFAREWNCPDPEVRYVAAMGISMCAGFFTLGLVEVMFLWWESYPFYAIGIAFFLMYIHKRKSHLALAGTSAQV